jgi:hypothetical protein
VVFACFTERGDFSPLKNVRGQQLEKRVFTPENGVAAPKNGAKFTKNY